jgi:hypothetical protein
VSIFASDLIHFFRHSLLRQKICHEDFWGAAQLPISSLGFETKRPHQRDALSGERMSAVLPN